MPTYEYACTSCGEHLEVVQSFSDEPLSTCPNCGAPLRKVFGSIGIVLKGSGFYKTDNRSANGAKAGAKKADSSSSDGGTASSGSSSPSSSDGSSGSSGSSGASSGDSAAATPAKAATA